MSTGTTLAEIDEAIAELNAEIAANPRDPWPLLDLEQLLLERADAVAGDAERSPDEVADALDLLRMARALAGGHRPAERTAIEAELARVLCWQWAAAGEIDQARADELVDSWCRAVALADEDDKQNGDRDGAADELFRDGLPVALDVIGLLLGRAGARDPAGLTVAVEHGTRALAVTAADDEDRHRLLFLLGLAHMARHDVTGGAEPADARATIGYLGQLRTELPDDHPATAEVALYLGLARTYRALQDPTGSGPLLVAAASELGFALRRLDEHDPQLTRLARLRLGIVQAVRFLCHGAAEDVRQEAVAELTAITEEIDDRRSLDTCHLLLAQLRLVRSWPAVARTGTVESIADAPAGATAPTGEDVAAALAHFSALSDGPADPALDGVDTLARVMVRLGALTGSRSVNEVDEVDKVNEVDAALRLLETFDATDEDASTMATLVRAGLLVKRAELTGDRSEAARAADHVRARLGDLPPDHPMAREFQQLIARLADHLADVARDGEGAADVVARIDRQLLDVPDDDPRRPAMLIKLAGVLIYSSMSGRTTAALERGRAILAGLEGHPNLTDADRAVMAHVLAGADAVTSYQDRDPAPLDRALERMRSVAANLPPDHPAHNLIGPGLAALLGQQFLLTGERDRLDAASYFLRPRGGVTNTGVTNTGVTNIGTADPMADREAPPGTVSERSKVITRLLSSLNQLVDTAAPPQPHEFDAFERDLQDARGTWLDSPELIDVDYMQAVLRAYRSGLGMFGSVTGWPAAAEFARSANDIEESLTGRPQDHLDPTHSQTVAGMAAIGAGFAARDDAAMRRGIAKLAETCDDEGITDHRRVQSLIALGLSLLMRHSRNGGRHDVNAAISRLEQAVRLMRQLPELPDSAVPFNVLGEAYIMRADEHLGDLRRATALGLEGLQRRSEEVLLQSGAARGLRAATAARDEAVDVARWCLRAGRPGDAVTALELGRGMVLHAATIERDFPALLAAAGHPELAGEWAAAPDSRPWDDDAAAPPWHLGEAPLPGTLRRRGLDAIRLSPVVRRLSPPTVVEIAGALAGAGATALVYLLPPVWREAGGALLVHASGDVEWRPLPGLTMSVVAQTETLAAAQRAVRDAADRAAMPAAVGAWRDRLDQLCRTAWVSVMGPLLDVAGTPGRARRLVMVPVGRLGAVPWHAAARPAGRGALRFACQDAIISYAASARQFVEAAGRGKLPLASAAAMVRVGDSGLAWADREFAVIRQRCYPDGTYLGEDAPVRPEAVSALLPANDRPGASVLHLGCHAVHAVPPVESALLLDGGRRLYVRDMLRQARHRPVGAPGGLVSLAACASDLTDEAHDEALTLATAFLAAGAAGVVGTRWPIADLPTALFMIMFHHYLNAGYPEPAVALRAAQLWMLDRHRRLPPGIDDERLVGAARRADLAAPWHWAGFTYQGS